MHLLQLGYGLQACVAGFGFTDAYALLSAERLQASQLLPKPAPNMTMKGHVNSTEAIKSFSKLLPVALLLAQTNKCDLIALVVGKTPASAMHRLSVCFAQPRLPASDSLPYEGAFNLDRRRCLISARTLK